MIAILTPHAVRTGRGGQGSNGDESVCLDELAFARFSPPPTPIIPLLLIPCEPPFVIFRLNYLDFLRAGVDEARYRAAFDALVRTIRAVKAGDAPTYRATSFEPLDFDLYLRTKTRDFVGRKWLIGDVFDRLKASDAPRALLLVGDPGWGKTAFAGHLFSANPGGQFLAAHFCRADRADSGVSVSGSGGWLAKRSLTPKRRATRSAPQSCRLRRAGAEWMRTRSQNFHVG